MSTTSSGPTPFSTSISWLQAVRILGNCARMLAVLKAVAAAFLHANTSNHHAPACGQLPTSVASYKETSPIPLKASSISTSSITTLLGCILTLGKFNT